MRTAEELQELLDISTRWAKTKKLEWKPSRCTGVSEDQKQLITPLILAGQELEVKVEAKYLGLVINM